MQTDFDLHILNGDYAMNLWKQCGFNGDGLVWREIYLEGPLPETDDLQSFRSARCEYLLTFDELSGMEPERLCRYLKKMDDSVLDLSGNSKIMLWFDSCMYDQTLLMRILYLLSRKTNGRQHVYLYCCEGNCLTLDHFREGAAKKVQLVPEDLNLAGKAWLLFQKKDASGMINLAASENFERLPKMQKALYRCAEDVPDPNGLTRTQRQILQLISEGKESFPEIFKGFDRFEEYPFLGDTACQRILNDLTRQGVLKCNEGKYLKV